MLGQIPPLPPDEVGPEPVLAPNEIPDDPHILQNAMQNHPIDGANLVGMRRKTQIGVALTTTGIFLLSCGLELYGGSPL